MTPRNNSSHWATTSGAQSKVGPDAPAKRSRARMLGTGPVTAPDLAAFTNTVMLRFLNYNDTYIALGSLDLSNVIPAAGRRGGDAPAPERNCWCRSPSPTKRPAQ